MKMLIEEEYMKKQARGDLDVLNTAARNANQHQQRLKMQIENMINNKKLSLVFIEKMKEHQKSIKQHQ